MRVDKANDDLKVFYYALLAITAMHALFIPFFYWLGIFYLAVFNLFSVAVYLYCIKLFPASLAKLDFRLLGFIVSTEVIAHSYLACYFLGLESGFQFYIFALIAFPLFGIKSSFLINFLKVILLVFSYLLLEIWVGGKTPQFEFSENFLRIMKYINISNFLIFSGCVSFAYTKATRQYQELLTELATIDKLTGLSNRRSLMTAAEKEIADSNKSGLPLSMLVIDIDHFKNINDTHGHLCGDYILSSLAELMRSVLRRQDTVGRWGGEEFMVLLPDADAEMLKDLGERLRLKINQTKFTYQNKEISISVTIGAAMLVSNDSFDSLTLRADQALYQGKKNGRNCYYFSAT